MGFIIKYSRFFHVVIAEDGTGNAIEGFRFFPTEECRRRLNNYNLVFRSRPTGFEVFYSETPLIPITSTVRFSFGFTIPEAAIFETYGLIKTDDADTTVYQPGLYFDNLNPDGSIISGNPASVVASGSNTAETVTAADTYKIFGQTFNVFDSTESTPPALYELTHKYEATLTQITPVEPAPGMDYLVTLINSVDREEDYLGTSGPYLLDADTDLPPSRNIYLNDELGQKSAQGVIDIYWQTAQNTIADPDGQQYQITFKPT